MIVLAMELPVVVLAFGIARVHIIVIVLAFELHVYVQSVNVFAVDISRVGTIIGCTCLRNYTCAWIVLAFEMARVRTITDRTCKGNYTGRYNE